MTRRAMPKAIRYTLVSLRDLALSAGPFALLAIGLLVLAYLWLDPTPPKRVTLATGPAQSAYDEFGKHYQKALAANGIEVRLLPSEGSSANLQLLRDGKADLGFVQGGTSGRAPGEAAAGIESLGSLFVEPIWLFYREQAAKKVDPSATLSALTQLAGLRLNVGTPGSGVPLLMAKLFEANGIAPQTIELSALDQTPATVAFLAGDLDALVFASAPESLMVQMLLQTPGVKLMDFGQSEAYSRRFPFLTPVLLPRGVVDLARDVPPENVRLVATTTALLAREGTHPALLQLFVQAARDFHGQPGWFNRAGAFPTIEHSEYPISREAERTIRSGAPLPATLPAVLAGQPGGAHVAGAGHHPRDPAAAVARGATAVRVPDPLAGVPLVRPTARAREPDAGAGRGSGAIGAGAGSARPAGGQGQRAAVVCRRAVRASQQHRRGAPAAARALSRWQARPKAAGPGCC